MRLLVTGYGPFGKFDSNPSRVLIEGCGRDHEILEVSYRFVDDWLTKLDPSRFDGLLLMGVNGGSDRMHLETIGHNRVGRSPDIRGYVPRRRQIERGGPWRRPSTLWRTAKPLVRGSSEYAFSSSAGSYLCNYVLYEALRRFPDKSVGFLHVPPFETMPMASQKEALERLIQTLEVEW